MAETHLEDSSGSSAKRFERMVKEKVWVYNLMLGLGPGSLRRGILTGEGVYHKVGAGGYSTKQNVE